MGSQKGNDERFNSIRLINGQELQAEIPNLNRTIIEQLMADPPYELQWLNYKQNHK